MDKLKLWISEVLIKKLGPSFIRGAIVGLTSFLIAHANLLGNWGVVYDATAHTIILNMDKLSVALILGLPAVIAAIVKLVNHTGNQLVLPVSKSS